MERIDDQTLLEELKRRMEESRIAVADLRAMTQSLEQVNEKLRQSEALKSDFLSNIRNEINNPLTSILGLTRQIIDRSIDAEAVQGVAATVYNEAFDLDFQLRNIFAAAELEAGEAALSAARVDVASLLESLVAAFEHKAAEKRVTVALDFRGGRPSAFTTDPEKLQRIVANLLANAIEFNREGKRVAILVQRDGQRLTIAIEDEGIGIPEAERKKVFDRFTQLDAGVRKRHRGHGLGLSITKALVKMLGGEVRLTSAASGGCVFSVSVPELMTEGPVDISSDDGNEFIFEEGTRF